MSEDAVPPEQKERSRKPFRGDETHNLPKGMREPYRLWFEFLKTALADPTISVNRDKYAPWGDVENTDFKSWWESHWRDLFAVPIKSVAVINSREEFDTAMADPSYLVVRVPVSLKAKLRDKELQRAIKTELRSNPRASEPEPPFAINKQMMWQGSVIRGLLNLYKLNLANNRNAEATAMAYYDWAKTWNDKITKKSKRKKIYMPPFLGDFVKAVEAMKNAPTKEKKKSERSSTGYDVLQNRLTRYIRQAETIAKNTARGNFPGKFDK